MQKYNILAALLLSVLPLLLHAQVDGVGTVGGADQRDLPDTLRLMPLPADTLPAAEAIGPRYTGLSLPPTFSMAAPGVGGFGPWDGWSGAWRLHEGLNAQVGLSLSTAFGKHAPVGVGFGQNVAFAYAMPLSKRLSVAAGVYASNMDWGSWHRTEAGLAALMAYKVNDVVSLYAYATKSFLPRNDRSWRGPMPLFLPLAGDRIGAMAEFKIGRNAMIQVAVEHNSCPLPTPLGLGGMPPYEGGR